MTAEKNNPMHLFRTNPFIHIQKKPLRMGIIGLGKISDIHFETFLHNKNVKIAALSDVRQDILQKKADQLHITTYATEYRKILQDPTLDVVDILLPHYLHADCVIAALQAGKHVICEKPLAITTRDIDRIAKASLAAKRSVHVKHYFRFATLHDRLRNLLLKNAIGKPSLITILYTTNAIDTLNDRSSWRGDLKKSGGGVLIDSGFHMIDLLQSYFGHPLSVYSVARKFSTTLPQKGEDTSATILTYAGNLTVTLVCTSLDTSLGNRWEKRFLGPLGSVVLEDHGKDLMTLTVWKHNKIVNSYTEQNWWNKTNTRALNDCIERILSGRPPAVSFGESKAALQTVLSAYKSGRSGRVIRLPNALKHYAGMG
jgi:predicted dehydrogenase